MITMLSGPRSKESNIQIQGCIARRLSADPRSRHVGQCLQHRKEALSVFVDHGPLAIEKLLLHAYELRRGVQLLLRPGAVASASAVISCLHHASQGGDGVPERYDGKPDRAERILHPRCPGRDRDWCARQHGWGAGMYKWTQGVDVSAPREGTVHDAGHDVFGCRASRVYGVDTRI